MEHVRACLLLNSTPAAPTVNDLHVMSYDYNMSAACTCSPCSDSLLHAGTNGSPAGSYGQAMTPTQLFSSYTEIQERYSAEKMKNRQHEIVLEQVCPTQATGPPFAIAAAASS